MSESGWLDGSYAGTLRWPGSAACQSLMQHDLRRLQNWYYKPECNPNNHFLNLTRQQPLESTESKRVVKLGLFCLQVLFWKSKGRNTPAQPLDVWSVWRDSDEVGNKSVWCVRLRWKLSVQRGRCLLRFSTQRLRRLAVGRLSHWILWLAVC